MIFSGYDMPLRKVLLQDATISTDTQEKLNCLIHKFKGIMSPSSNDIGYTKLIEMNIETIQTYSQ